MSRCAISALLAVAVAAWSAQARDAEGRLGLIQAPHNAWPAVVSAGGEFEARLRAPGGALRLRGDNVTVPLEAQFSPPDPRGHVRARCEVPPGTPPGVYALEAGAARVADVNERAVFVLDLHADAAYTIAHIADPRLTPEQPERTRDFAALLDAAHRAGSAAVLISGEVSAGGAAEAFRTLLKALDASPLPTYVSPGGGDYAHGLAPAYFGPPVRHAWFGRDALFAFDTIGAGLVDELGPQLGALQVQRRAVRPARHTIGFTHRAAPTMSMRAQLVLFSDDPLPCLLTGQPAYIEAPLDDFRMPWGRTALSTTPEPGHGQLRLVDVSPGRITSRLVSAGDISETAQ